MLLGYREFLRACDRAGTDTKKEVRGRFKKVGDIVKVDAADRFREIHPRTADRFRTYVRARGVSVEQSLRKSKTVQLRRPNFGELQLREALEPSLAQNAGEIVREFERAIDQVADHFDKGS